MTEQEIAAGVFDVADAPEHVFCFFRKIIGADGDPGASAFFDINHEAERETLAAVQLWRLKDALRERLPGNIKEYEAEWTGSGITAGHLDEFCEDAYGSIVRVIDGEIAKRQEVDVLDQEIVSHEVFGTERARFFVGQASILRMIDSYLQDSSGRPLIIHGVSGSGKSALMGQAVKRARSEHPGTIVISQFLGVTPASSTARPLLESLCSQISRAYGVEPYRPPATYKELVQEFHSRLSVATSDRPLVLFIDALDQLVPEGEVADFTWFPGVVPSHVRLIVSSLAGGSLAIFERALPSANLHIPPDYVVERVTLQRKPPEVRICRVRNQSAVGTRPPSTSTPH
jgi:hypothetical protein